MTRCLLARTGTCLFSIVHTVVVVVLRYAFVIFYAPASRQHFLLLNKNTRECISLLQQCRTVSICQEGGGRGGRRGSGRGRGERRTLQAQSSHYLAVCLRALVFALEITRPAVCPCSMDSDRLDGLVVKVSASGAEDPGFGSRSRRDSTGLSHTSDLKIGTPVATLPGTWRYRVSAGTGRPCVSIL